MVKENELSKIVLDIAFKIHRELGPGLFESVYEAILTYELADEYGLIVQRQHPIPVEWEKGETGYWIPVRLNCRK